MLTVRLAGDNLFEKWLSLVMPLMVSFLLFFFFSRVVLDGICDLIESVSQGFSTYFYLS